MSKVQGKIAVVTGGNSGIGYATAKELKAQGATVIITGRRKEAIEKAGQELGVTALVSDQSSLPAIDQLVKDVTGLHGKVDILFINAGVVELFPVEMATESQFDNIMDINFKGAYFTLSKFVPHLQNGASVVFLASNAAQDYHAGGSIYSASKAALVSVMKTAALELAPLKIRVNSVSPGPTETEIMRKAGLDAATLDHLTKAMADKVPLGKWGAAKDVAKMVVYLSDSAASFITGSDFVIDGGLLLV